MIRGGRRQCLAFQQTQIYVSCRGTVVQHNEDFQAKIAVPLEGSQQTSHCGLTQPEGKYCSSPCIGLTQILLT